jgi:hypothetical protein
VTQGEGEAGERWLCSDAAARNAEVVGAGLAW